MRLVPAARRGQVMAIAVAVPAVAPAVGPALSGLVLSNLHWRWLFIIMLPVALFALALGAWKLRNITTPEPATLDIVSLTLSVIGFGALVYGLASIGESVAGHAPIPPYAPIAIGQVGIAAFVHRQVTLQRRGAAFLGVRVFADRGFTVPLLVTIAVALVCLGSSSCCRSCWPRSPVSAHSPSACSWSRAVWCSPSWPPQGAGRTTVDGTAPTAGVDGRG